MVGSARTPNCVPWPTGRRGAPAGAAWRRTPVGSRHSGQPATAVPADRMTRSAALVADVPAVFRRTRFDPRDPVLAPVFMTGSRTTGFSTEALPEPMQRELSWWLATCAATGE